MLRHVDLPDNDRNSTFLPELSEKYKANSTGGGSYIMAYFRGYLRMRGVLRGGSSVAGSDNPHDGTLMPLGAVHPICRSEF